MRYIFFIASFNAIFFLVLLLQKKPKLIHDRILILWLLYLAVATTTYAFTVDLFSNAPILSSGVIGLFLLHGPFMYLYVNALISSHKSYTIKKLGHFAPFIAFILYLIIASQFPIYSKGINVDHTSRGIEPPLIFMLFLIATALSGPLYFFLAYRRFKQIKESTEDFTSRDINLDWLGKLIIIFGIIWTVLILIAVIHHVFHLFSMVFCTNGLFLALSAFIILIGYFGLNQKEVFISHAAEETDNSIATSRVKYAASKLEGAELQKCFQDIEAYMKSERPYLDPDLTLPKLAKGLEVSTHHLSQVINEMHGRNFFDFINQFRVEEVKKKIQDEKFQKYSLLGIAFESGFNSKSAFNRVFKKVAGKTPSQFRDCISKP